MAAASKKKAASRILSADEILAADDIQRECVEVPEWGGSIYVQTMTAEARDAYELSILDPSTGKSDLSNMQAKLVARCAVDAEGNRLFTDAQVEALGRKSARALQRCSDAAQRLAGISNADLDALGNG